MLAMAPGCDKPEQKNIITTTTRPAAETVEAPATRPADMVFLIDGKPTVFPAARIVVQQTEPYVSLLLFSDDSPDALRPTYEGNRFYFTLELRDVSEMAELVSRDVHIRATSMERRDVPDGIFLRGDKEQLQAYDVTVAFSKHGSELLMDIRGQFLRFRNRPDTVLGQTVQVQAVLYAEPEFPGGPRN
jgi:hypothetical protein